MALRNCNEVVACYYRLSLDLKQFKADDPHGSEAVLKWNQHKIFLGSLATEHNPVRGKCGDLWGMRY